MKTFLTRYSLIIGIALMFLYTWTIDLSNSGILPFKVPFFVAMTLGWGFIFVSLFMTWLTLGKDEMTRLFKRFFLWSVGWKWWMVALLLLPALRFAALLLTALLTSIPADFSHPMIRDVVPLDASLLMLVVPWIVFEILTNGEEMGWRGYVLPRLQAKYNALIASLIVGVIWAVWHLPKFFGTGLNGEGSFAWFTVAHLALAVLYTWLYNNTRGSLLLVTLFHASGNTFGMFMPAKFAVTGGILSNLEIVFFVIAAIVVTILAGPANLSRTEERQIQGVTMKNRNRSMGVHKVYILALLTMLLLSFAAQTGEVAAGEKMSVSQNQAEGPSDAAEMEAFMDELFARQMEENHIAGAAVAVVKDGQLFFAKGYGYADVENKIPVDAETTIFRTGSVGKVITWTAVMQLVEQGKLDLDADINTYLDFRIPDTYPQPITLKHLMTHTSGIEDRWLESLTADAGELVSEREWLVANFPGRVRPPGEAAGYSNYNAMLGGYIVARVSGEPYEEYIQKHIFDPLGMTHSTVQPQIPAELLPFASKSYIYADDAFQPFPDYLTQSAVLPSGFHQTSATDMARFMIARLEGGFYGDVSTEIRILEESTAQEILTTLYTPDPRLKGTAYGLFDFSDNGQWVLGHEGYAPVMVSQLLLLPDQHLGVFVVYNSLGARDGGLTPQHVGFQRAFFDHYYPAPAVEPIQPPADFAERAERFAGFYRTANSHATTPEKVIGLLGGFTIEVTAPGDGTLLIPMEGLELRFVEVEPLFFRQVDGSFTLVFREDDKGNITHLFTDIQPQNGFVKLGWYEAPGFNMVLIQVCLLILLSMLPVTVVRFIQKRRSGDEGIPASHSALTADSVIFSISLLNLLFLVGLAIWFRPMHPSELHSLSLTVEIVMGLGVLAALLTPVALVYAALAWKDGYWGIAYRVYYTLVTVAAVGFVWFLHYWNWLGWRY